CAWRQIGQIEASILARDREVRMFEDRNVAPHPWVDIALHPNRDLFAWKGFVNLRTGRFSLVPFHTVGWHSMDIVASGIVIHHLQPLVRLQSQHVRLIHATLLLDNRGLRWGIKRAVAQAISYEDDYVLQTAFRVGHDVLTQNWSGMLFGAAWVSCHIDGCGFGHSAVELHFTSDGGCARCTICRTGRTFRSYDAPAGDADGHR